MNEEDVKWMRRALALAEKGQGHTRPNPAVGAVLVRRGRVLGEGYHRRAGRPHAEVEAIRDARKRGHKRLAGATMYVTLEPCCTHGRTPPCTEAILCEKIARVVVGTTDPNPCHAGRAYTILRDAGVEVVAGVCERECRLLNRAFNHWIITGRPWVVAKVAATLDGCLALPEGMGRWISSEQSRKEVHRLRARCGAVLVGAGTVRADNPRLTARGVRCVAQPLRVVVSRGGKLPKKAHLFTDEYASLTRVCSPRSWRKLLLELGAEGVNQLLVEGGARVLDSMARAGMINEVLVYYAPVTLTAAERRGLPKAGFLKRLNLAESSLEPVGPDLRLRATASFKG